MRRMSGLFTCEIYKRSKQAAMKVIKDLAYSSYIESTTHGQQWRKLAPPRVNNIYIEESILLPYTSVETRSVK